MADDLTICMRPLEDLNNHTFDLEGDIETQLRLLPETTLYQSSLNVTFLNQVAGAISNRRLPIVDPITIIGTASPTSLWGAGRA